MFAQARPIAVVSGIALAKEATQLLAGVQAAPAQAVPNRDHVTASLGMPKPAVKAARVAPVGTGQVVPATNWSVVIGQPAAVNAPPIAVRAAALCGLLVKPRARCMVTLITVHSIAFMSGKRSS